jgi:hypothetical protein
LRSRAERYPIEGITDDIQTRPASVITTLTLAIEELEPEFRFERLDLMTDRALRHEQVFRRARKTLVAGGSLERLQCGQRWQTAEHGRSRLHENNWGTVEKRCFAGKPGPLLST